MTLNITAILVIAMIGMLLISLPYLYHLFISERQKKTDPESFQEFTSTRKLVLDKVQKWRNHYMLGLDLKQNVLVYCRFGHYPAQMTVNLNEIDHASIDAHYEEPNMGKSKLKKLGYLVILLHFKDQSKAAKSITIFDERQIRTISDEPFIAENWVHTLNQHLKAGGDSPLLRLAM